ncbi:MAG TPA: lamin tail domain-containing protein, partial [Candidatus Staskawiczbacteria bacterium]|nr:lamin tail domain-containing protein [Candidatus Staskawiczbacteria bacterium]
QIVAAQRPAAISEIQVAGDTDEKEEFVELYNPNSDAVSLTGWYLQRKTATGQSYSSWASSTLFKGKTIPAKGYFVIARENYFASQADIFTTNSISGDNSFILKNPGGEISDKVGWGNAQDFETQPTINPENSQTIGRIFLGADNTEKDTQNNFSDFQAQMPTPAAQNTAFTPENPENPENPDNGDQEETVRAAIVINEIQVEGADDEKEEFVELYNPTDQDVDLTGWYLQRKTAEGEDFISYAPSALFDGKIIASESYFVIAREGYFTDKGDVFTTNPLTDSNTLVLKRKGGSVADKVGWGEAQDFETAPAEAPQAGQSIERKIAGQDTDNNFADFVIRGEATPSDDTFGLTIKDATEYANNYSPDQLKYTLKLAWNSKVNNAFYDVQYKFNNSGWQPWLTHTIGESDYFTNALYSIIEDKNVYSFRAKVFDSHGNGSGWKQVNIDLSVPVVINEAEVSQDNQWLEFYNKTAKDIDLTGWKLDLPGGPITLAGTIKAKGYFLLEANNLKQNYLRLRQPNGLFVDELYASNFNGIRERISPWAYGSEAKNWLDETSATQGQQNTNYQLYTYLPLKIQRSLTLPQKLSPYYLNNKNMEVSENVSLTFEPDVVVKMAGSGIISNGKITAIGTQQKPIVFTSFKDASPAAGDWFGIILTDKNQGSKFKYVEFKYGGGDLSQFGAVLKASQNPVEVENCLFEDNINRGLQLINTASNIKNNKFVGIDESQSANIKPSGIFVAGGADKIENNYFEANHTGIEVNDGSGPEGNISIIGND